MIKVRLRLLAWTTPVLAIALCGACAPSSDELRVRLESYDPAARIRAIATVAEHQLVELIPALVDRLDDEDPAVRFSAILALEDLTGTRLGYSYAAPRPQRRAATDAWRRYVADRAEAEQSQAPTAEGSSGRGAERA